MKNSSRRLARREIRFLESEVKMLQHYLAECLDMLQDYETEWRDDYIYFVNFFDGDVCDNDQERDLGKILEININDTNKLDEEKINENIDMQAHIPSWAKKLYKKIAMITHPDRIKDERRRQSLEKIFLKASESMKNRDYEDLISIALDFDLSSGLDDISLRPVLKNQISKIKKEISRIESDISWAWGESFGIHNIRCQLLKQYLREKNIQTDDEILIDAIRERENQVGDM